jgi:hypothetical protein
MKTMLAGLLLLGLASQSRGQTIVIQVPSPIRHPGILPSLGPPYDTLPAGLYMFYDDAPPAAVAGITWIPYRRYRHLMVPRDLHRCYCGGGCEAWRSCR